MRAKSSAETSKAPADVAPFASALGGDAVAYPDFAASAGASADVIPNSNAFIGDLAVCLGVLCAGTIFSDVTFLGERIGDLGEESFGFGSAGGVCGFSDAPAGRQPWSVAAACCVVSVSAARGAAAPPSATKLDSDLVVLLSSLFLVHS
jgi:hypothetical protein